MWFVNQLFVFGNRCLTFCEDVLIFSEDLSTLWMVLLRLNVKINIYLCFLCKHPSKRLHVKIDGALRAAENVSVPVLPQWREQRAPVMCSQVQRTVGHLI